MKGGKMIERNPTAEERTDFEPIGKGNDIAKDKFYDELTKQEQNATKKGLPFASKVAIDDFNDEHKKQVDASMRKNGGFVLPSDLKVIKMDWKKYSDLSNFDLIDEGEVADGNLTKHNPGLDVKIQYKRYKYKGYNNTYQMMEDATSAILRARKKLKELEAETGGKK